MIDIKLDESDGSPVLENGDLVFISGDEQIAQAVRIRLRSWKGEWFLDQSYGVDWLGKVFVKPFQPTVARKEIERVILGTPGVKRVASFQQSISGETYTYSAEVVTENNARFFVSNTVGNG